MQSDAVLLFHGLDLSARVLWTTQTRRKQQSQHSAARSAPLAVITAAPGLRTVCNYTPRSKAINWSVPPSAGQRLTVPNCPAPTFSWTLDKIANSLTVAHPMEPWQVLDGIESLARTDMLSRFNHGQVLAVCMRARASKSPGFSMTAQSAFVSTFALLCRKKSRLTNLDKMKSCRRPWHGAPVPCRLLRSRGLWLVIVFFLDRFVTVPLVILIRKGLSDQQRGSQYYVLLQTPAPLHQCRSG